VSGQELCRLFAVGPNDTVGSDDPIGSNDAVGSDDAIGSNDAVGSNETIGANDGGIAKALAALKDREDSTVAQNEGNKTGCDCGECESCEKRLAEESLEEGEVPAGLARYQDEQAAKAGKTSSEAPKSVDADDDDTADSDDADDTEETVEERIQTPEQEDSLYESRFAHRNTRLFEKLLKEWTK